MLTAWTAFRQCEKATPLWISAGSLPPLIAKLGIATNPFLSIARWGPESTWSRRAVTPASRVNQTVPDQRS